MENRRTIKIGTSALLSQLGMLAALFLDTLFESHAGVDRLASWGLTQAIWLSLFLFCTGTLYVLDAPLVTARDRSERSAVLAGGLRAALILALGSIALALGIESMAFPSGAGVSLTAMSATFFLWLPFFAVRQHALTGGDLMSLNLANAAGFVAHVGVLAFFGTSPLGVPAAHATDRAATLLVLFGSTSAKDALRAKPCQAAMSYISGGMTIGLLFVSRSLVFTIVTAALARFGTGVAAAQGVLLASGNLLMMLPSSISVATSVNVARRAEVDAGAAREEVLKSLAVSTALLVLVLLPILLFRAELSSVFSSSIEVSGLIAAAIPALAAFVLIDSMPTIMIAAFRGIRKPGVAFALFAGAFTLAGGPLLSLTLARKPAAPLPATWATLAAVSMILGFLMFRSFNRLVAASSLEVKTDV